MLTGNELIGLEAQVAKEREENQAIILYAIDHDVSYQEAKRILKANNQVINQETLKGVNDDDRIKRNNV